jgi:hypothetical protein
MITFCLFVTALGLLMLLAGMLAVLPLVKRDIEALTNEELDLIQEREAQAPARRPRVSRPRRNAPRLEVVSA